MILYTYRGPAILRNQARDERMNVCHECLLQSIGSKSPYLFFRLQACRFRALCKDGPSAHHPSHLRFPLWEVYIKTLEAISLFWLGEYAAPASAVFKRIKLLSKVGV